MPDLASDLAAIRGREHNRFLCVCCTDLPRLLARLEEMRKGLERIQMAAGNADASTGCRLILAEVKRLLHPLREPG